MGEDDTNDNVFQHHLYQDKSVNRPHFQPSTLQYSIQKCSSYSSTYFPENILEDRPGDQTSRWSSDSNTPPQYLTLSLQSPSIIQSITFGKFEKTHVCNLKKFKVFGGLSPDNLVELLEGGLKNDSNPETFKLKHEVSECYFPCKYIQIVPLQSWGPSFNFSIWFVELRGTEEWEIVGPAIRRLNEYREREAIRVCLKHLREHNYTTAFESLQKKTRVQLEHPHLTNLYSTLVLQGDFDSTEKFLENSIANRLFQDYLSRQDYKTNWRMISSNNNDVVMDTTLLRPGCRGGHQMCIDSQSETIYLFGGWDGHQDLADFWAFDIRSNTWRLLSSNTEQDGGPGPRSCHKIVLDEQARQIFTLGRYVDSSVRSLDRGGKVLKSDFFVYDIETAKWTLICEDTSVYGGPHLIFDHQMVLDSGNRVIYVFGGRVLSGGSGGGGGGGGGSGMGDGGVLESLNLNSELLAFVVNNQQQQQQQQQQDNNHGNNDNNDESNNIMQLNRNDGMIELAGSGNNDRGLQLVGGGGGSGRGGASSSSSSAAAAVAPGSSRTVESATTTSSANSELSYSGLWKYHIPTNTWELLRPDVGSPVSSSKGTIKSRVGHSMLFHSGLRKLFVFGGQRSKNYLNDFLSYHVDKDELEGIGHDQLGGGGGGGGSGDVNNSGKVSSSNGSIPTTGFTQRATIDLENHEIYIFSGLSKDKDSRHENVQNSFWVYDILRKSWSCIYKNDVGGGNSSGGGNNDNSSSSSSSSTSGSGWGKNHHHHHHHHLLQSTRTEPCPRFAHQLVYDTVNKIHYLFGGNPGRAKEPKLRLNDFWKLQLIRPSQEDLLRQCKLMVRKLRFEELACQDGPRALVYLQTRLSEIIDHGDRQQTEEFQRLTLLLFEKEEEKRMRAYDNRSSSSSSPSNLVESDSSSSSHNNDEVVLRRSQLFDKLVRFYPEGMSQPKINLVDLLPL